MEALATFSVACNVLQVIETATNVLNRSVQIYQDVDGLAAEHRTLKGIASHLNQLNEDLATTMPISTISSLSTGEQRLRDTSQECLSASKECLAVLNSCKATGTGKLNAFAASVRAHWRRDKIQTMEKAVTHARENLNVSVLLCMNTNMSKITTRTDLESEARALESNMLQAIDKTSDKVQDDLQALSTRLDQTVNTSDLETMKNDFLREHAAALRILTDEIKSALSHQQKADAYAAVEEAA